MYIYIYMFTSIWLILYGKSVSRKLFPVCPMDPTMGYVEKPTYPMFFCCWTHRMSWPKKPLESLWLTLDGFKGIEIIQVGTSGLDPSIPVASPRSPETSWTMKSWLVSWRDCLFHGLTTFIVPIFLAKILKYPPCSGFLRDPSSPIFPKTVLSSS